METLMVKVKSKSKAEELLNILRDLKFVSDVQHLESDSESTVAEEEITLIKKAIVKKKNKAIGKYL